MQQQIRDLKEGERLYVMVPAYVTLGDWGEHCLYDVDDDDITGFSVDDPDFLNLVASLRLMTKAQIKTYFGDKRRLELERNIAELKIQLEAVA